MKNVFVLTKSEQRVIILIVAAVLAFATVKRYRENLTNPPPTGSAVTPGASPILHHEGEDTAPDEAP